MKLRIKLILLFILSSCCCSVFGSAENNTTYQYQLLGFSVPKSKPITRYSICKIDSVIDDVNLNSRSKNMLEKAFRRQLKRFIEADNRFANEDISNCIDLKFRLVNTTDELRVEETSSYVKINFFVEVLSSIGQPIASVHLSSKYVSKEDIFEELPAVYIYSTREKTKAMSLLFDEVEAFFKTNSPSRTLMLNHQVNIKDMDKLIEPVALFRTKQYEKLISTYRLEDVTDSYLRLDAFCSAAMALSHFALFFECIDYWDKSSFSVITGYTALDQQGKTLWSIQDQVKSLVHAPSLITQSLYRWEVGARKNRLLCEAWYRLSNYTKSKQFCDKALKLYRPDHQIWSAPMKRYTVMPNQDKRKGSSLSFDWSVPGGSSSYHWTADILLTSSLAAQSNIQLNGKAADSTAYLGFLDNANRSVTGADWQVGFDRLRILFKNPIYFLTGEYEKLTFLQSHRSQEMNEMKGAGLTLLSGAAFILEMTALVNGEFESTEDDSIFSLFSLSRGLLSAADDMYDTGYFDAISYREQFQKAYILFTKGMYKLAIDRVNGVLVKQILENEKELYWNALKLLGMCYYELGKYSESMQAYEIAMDVIEQIKGTISIESQKMGFLSEKDEVYQRAALVAVKLGDVGKALVITERARARALLDLMADTLERRSTSALSSASKPIPNTRQTATDLEPSLLPTKQSKLRGLVRVNSQILSQEKDVLSNTSVEIPSLEELTASLAINDVAVIYAKLLNQYVAFKVTHNDINLIRLNDIDIDTTIKTYVGMLQDPSSTRYLSVSATLYEKLIQPLKLSDSESLIISKVGSLNYLPFASLYDGEHFLIEKHSLRSIPSLTTLSWIPDNSNNKRLLAIGNPTGDLLGTEKEVTQISSLFPDNAVLLGAQANIDAFVQHAPEYNLIHFAMHGVYDSARVSQSRLLFTQGRYGKPTPFFISDVLSLKLNANLVVLSACESGLNQVSKGDEIIGFTRTFLQAGANNIISSLWKVDDFGTYELMSQFYDNIKTNPYHKSLQIAQLAMMESKYSHPYYWAAFTFSGQG